MAEIYLPFSDENVRAIAEGRKTQTRRPIKGMEAVVSEGVEEDRVMAEALSLSLPASPGDILCVKEALEKQEAMSGPNLVEAAVYSADGRPVDHAVPWRWKRWKLPSIFMPYAYCRYKYPLVGFWPEKLGDISEEDAEAEGVRSMVKDEDTHRHIFALKWHEIYGKWDPKLWVWVYDWGEPF